MQPQSGSGEESPSYTNNKTTTEDVNRGKTHVKFLDKCILERESSDFLHNQEDTAGWDSKSLSETFLKACKVSNGEMLVELYDFFTQKRVIVLGIYAKDKFGGNYHESYKDKAQKINDCIVFSMEDKEWNELNLSEGDRGWILNKFFLEYWMSKDCTFLLLSNPNCFYIPGSGEPHVYEYGGRVYGTYYSKELKCINDNGYNWNSSHLGKALCNCAIEAIRGGVYSWI